MSSTFPLCLRQRDLTRLTLNQNTSNVVSSVFRSFSCHLKTFLCKLTQFDLFRCFSRKMKSQKVLGNRRQTYFTNLRAVLVFTLLASFRIFNEIFALRKRIKCNLFFSVTKSWAHILPKKTLIQMISTLWTFGWPALLRVFISTVWHFNSTFLL